MRKQLAFVTLAVSTLVVLASLVPLGILVRNQAENRALTRAERDAQSIATAMAVASSAETGAMVTQGLAEAVIEAFGSPASISIVFPDRSFVGRPVLENENLQLARDGAAFTAMTEGGAEVLVPVLVADSPTAGDTVVVRSFVPGEELSQGVAAAWAMLFGLGVFLVVVALLAADRLGRSITRPVTVLSVAARQMGEGDLDVRVEPAGPEEVADVGEAFNFLAGRLGVLLTAERESVADLSHRLRTPMTTLRLQAETLSDPAEAGALLADIEALERAIDRLITEARRPSGGEDRPDRAADLAETVSHRASFWQVLADEQGRPTSLLIEPDEYPVAISSAELGALVDTLIENVFTHTEYGVGYILRVRKLSDGRSSLTVQDEGSGFVDLNVLRRGESSRGGTGLGLDIVARAAERSGGGFRIGNSPSGGAEVVVAFGLPQPATGATASSQGETVDEPSAPVPS